MHNDAKVWTTIDMDDKIMLTVGVVHTLSSAICRSVSCFTLEALTKCLSSLADRSLRFSCPKLFIMN